MPGRPDRRRTLLWNPSLHTDANGEVSLDLYNGAGATFLNINAETLADGRPAPYGCRTRPNSRNPKNT